MDMYQKMGWHVEDVSKVRGKHAGYDLLLNRRDEILTVEVKGCSRLYQIPDLFSSEIERETKALIADELCVVYFLTGTSEPKVARIPRSALRADHITEKYGYRISGKFKNERNIGPYIIKSNHIGDQD